MANHKNVYIIAGPNGSGKTTFAREFLPNYAKCPNFVNADLIAQGLSPFLPRQVAIKAGKLVLQQIKEFMDRNVDFGFETTLSGKTHIKLFQSLKEKGYKLHLFFLWIPTSELALARIKDRVAEGGHDVPVEDVKRRFKRSTEKFFKEYRPLVDKWVLFNNEGAPPQIIAKKQNDHIDIVNQILFDKIRRKVGVES
jgi:predicted ABC-type ATPase